jgi:lipoate-protein ligase A
MALDRSLLDWVSQDPARLVFRTYGWERPTLSLGRREPYPQGWDTNALARAGIEVVRRPTGGNAVLHVEEVTFALAASVPGPWELTPRGFTNAAAEALARALARCGLEGATLEEANGGRLQPEGPRPAPHEEPALCFARSAPGEVLVRGFKVAGLAARFDRGGALCHASIPLTARGRSLARFRLVPGGDAEALERNARSVGELIEESGEDFRALEARVGEALAVALAARFGARWSEAAFEAVGTAAPCEPVSSR